MDDRIRRAAVPAAAGALLIVAALASAAGLLDWTAVGGWLRRHAGSIALTGCGAVLVALAVVEFRRGPARRSPLSWGAVAAGAALVGVVAVGATAWLLGEAAAANDPAAARVEAVKTGLGIGAGTGGVLALLLAVRRQWHQEVTAVDTAHDATERRVTDLYTKAAEQLGSDKAPVRMAGLYALERLAQDHVGQRQTMVNLLCAYLRMPYDESVQEGEVRLTAQRVLTAHLQPKADGYWADADLDLSGATLIDFSLADCAVRSASFRRAEFVGRTRFSNCRFSLATTFDSAVFSGFTTFHKAVFHSDARFIATHFAGGFFNGVTFARNADFSKAVFSKRVSFSLATFAGGRRTALDVRTPWTSFGGAQFVNVPAEIRPFIHPSTTPAEEESE